MASKRTLKRRRQRREAKKPKRHLRPIERWMYRDMIRNFRRSARVMAVLRDQSEISFMGGDQWTMPIRIARREQP